MLSAAPILRFQGHIHRPAVLLLPPEPALPVRHGWCRQPKRLTNTRTIQTGGCQRARCPGSAAIYGLTVVGGDDSPTTTTTSTKRHTATTTSDVATTTSTSATTSTSGDSGTTGSAPNQTVPT